MAASSRNAVRSLPSRNSPVAASSVVPQKKSISLSEWESLTQLTPEEQMFLDSVQMRDPFTQGHQHASGSSTASAGAGVGAGLSTGTTSSVIRAMDFFELVEKEHEQTLLREAKGAYEEQILKLEMQVRFLRDALVDIGAALAAVAELETFQKDAAQRATSLHELCTTLQKQLSELQVLHVSLSQRLRYFEIPDNLQGFDEALAFLESHPFYLEARQTAAKLRVAKAKMMGSVRDSVIRAFQREEKRAKQSLVGNSHAATPSASSVASTRTHANVEDDQEIGILMLGAQLKHKIESLEDVYLEDVLSYYRNWRARIITIPKFTDLFIGPKMEDLISTCKQEYDYAAALFRDTAAVSVPQLVASFLYRVVEDLRPLIIRETRVDALCALVRFLKETMLGGLIPQNAPGALPLEVVVKQVMHDAQERLLFRTQIFIKDDVRGYVPHTAGETKYPDVLIDNPDAYYGSVSATVTLLKMLQSCLDTSVFQSVSFEAIEGCVASCVGSAVSPGIDRELFLIRNLFHLRDSFEELHSVAIFTDKTLDLASLTSHFADLLTGRKSLLLWLTKGLQIRESRSDSKRDMEKETRRACESLVMEWTRLLLDPLLSHIAKATALQRSRHSTSVEQNSYLEKDHVTELMTRVVGHMEERLPLIFKKLFLYFDHHGEIRRLLMGPVRQNAVDAFGQMSSLLHSHGVPPADRLSWGVLSSDAVEMIFREKEKSVASRIPRLSASSAASGSGSASSPLPTPETSPVPAQGLQFAQSPTASQYPQSHSMPESQLQPP
eukprot:ANDGO_03628.mRNA.1 Conserved oligomeric Golgi complex subunit 3